MATAGGDGVGAVTNPYNCQECGACCIHAGEVEVGLDEPTPKYLTRSVRRRMGFFSDDWLDRRCMAKDDAGRCRALRGDIGVSVRCSIYSKRPVVCRTFEPDCPECNAARTLTGLETSS